MFKKILLGIALAAVAAVLVFGAIQRTSAASSENGAGGGRWSSGSAAQSGGRRGGANGSTDGAAVSPQASSAPAGAANEGTALHVDTSTLTPGKLSAEEAAGLAWMREEEKLARDVYLALYDQWGQATFQNIASSEQTHMDAVLDLLNAYGIADPALAQGQFTNPQLQALYDQLTAQGRQSLADALKVGAAIEEIDILDLRQRSAQTDEAAIQSVYASLESGSQNHLRSFTSTLARRTGETYQPQYLTTADYQAIVGTASTTGGQSAGGNGYRGGR